MSLVAILRHGLRLLLPLAVAQTFYLYLYPIFMGCAFPLPSNATFNGTKFPTQSPDSWEPFLETAHQHLPLPIPPLNSNSTPAPFRLLALGDPQLEGDTSIPNLFGPRLPHARSLWKRITNKKRHDSLRDRIRQSLHDYIDFLFEDIPNELESFRKHIDLFGNDFYLAHIYRTVHWWTKPTHVSVLGDLIGSQWIRDDEFKRRGHRFWNRVLRGAEMVPEDIQAYPSMEYDLSALLGPLEHPEEAEAWTRRVINVAGNHDIGYAGDINKARLRRFEKLYGKANYELRFELPVSQDVIERTVFDEVHNPKSDNLMPELRIVVLNDMNLDTPVREKQLQEETYQFMNDVIKTSTAVEFNGHFTIVLTHIPLYKEEGICVDAPLFSFYDRGAGLREQNQLSAPASKGLLEGIYGMSGDPAKPAGGRGRPGVILNGHDHEGCDTYHYIRQEKKGKGKGKGKDKKDERAWQVRRWEDANKENDTVVGAEGMTGLREITVRSMMGDFGGNTGLLSAWFDEESWSWKFEYATCALGRQHFWWAVHITDFLLIVATVVYLVLLAAGYDQPKPEGKQKQGRKVVAKDNDVKANGAAGKDSKAAKTVAAPVTKEGKDEKVSPTSSSALKEGQAASTSSDVAKTTTTTTKR